MVINRDLVQDLPPLGIKRRYSSPQPVPPSRVMLERFTNPLDGTFEMAVDGSSTPVSFRAPVPAGFNCLVLNAHFYLCDTLMRPSFFGGITELTNGCQVSFRAGGDNALVLLAGAEPAISDGFGYKTNAEWLTSAGTNFVFWDGGANDDLFAWSYPFQEGGISIQLEEGDYMEMLIRDDLTGIDSFQGSMTARLVAP